MSISNFEEICTTGKGTIKNYSSDSDLFKGSYPSATEIQYKRTMEREGKTLTTYTGGAEFKAFFRINNDNENQRETIVIYYDVTAPVRPGTLVMYGYGVYLALNRETVENDVYYKSTLVKCNGVYNENSGAVMNIPFYSDNMKSSVSVGNSVITTLNGNIEIITEENSLSKKIAIDQKFNEFGRTFNVCNLYSMDGILHIIAEVYANQTPTYTYSVVIDGTPTTSLKTGERVQLTATTYMGETITTGATLDWTSSDNTIATVDGTGLVTCVSEGTATITCTWVEQDVKGTATINISNTEPVTPTGYTYTITGTSRLRIGVSRTYTLTITDSAGNDVTSSQNDYTWNLNCAFDNKIDKVISNNKITLTVEDENLIDETFTLEVLINSNVQASMVVDIIDIM